MQYRRWIPDGQLCPTVPNRSNYIHWIEDLLSSDIITNSNADGDDKVIKGFDIGTGANCIYPLLGSSLLGWSFVGSDVTEVALEWAKRNVKSNPHISELIEIRKVGSGEKTSYGKESCNGQSIDMAAPSSTHKLHSDVNKSYHGPPILLGVVGGDEKFDFCMCNPPFFGTMEEAGLNPRTSCGGTPEEMVCPGGEEAFIVRIIEDSVQLKQSFRWYTSMVGRKSNLKILIAKLREVGVTIVKTTEFVQGQTCRWGLAWSFMLPARKIISSHVAEKSSLSFTLEGLQRQYSALYVLQYIEAFFCSAGSSCKSNVSAFTVDVTASNNHCDAILKNGLRNINEPAPFQYKQVTSSGLSPTNDLSFRILVIFTGL
ncbi:23S rRNA (adenine(1618)-N(6))-methyltransferase [Sarracenia purpurea var. burkii]